MPAAPAICGRIASASAMAGKAKPWPASIIAAPGRGRRACGTAKPSTLPALAWAA
jgi:hypothetical protein